MIQDGSENASKLCLKGSMTTPRTGLIFIDNFELGVGSVLLRFDAGGNVTFTGLGSIFLHTSSPIAAPRSSPSDGSDTNVEAGASVASVTCFMATFTISGVVEDGSGGTESF